MRIVTITLSLLLAYLLEEAMALGFWNVPLPLLLAVSFFWFWRLELGERLLIAGVVGVILDSFHSFAFGTYTLGFFAGALIAEALYNTFSRPSSLLSQSVSMGAFIFLTQTAWGVIAVLLGSVSGQSVYWPIVPALQVFFAVTVWSGVAAFAYAFILKFSKNFGF